MLYCVDSQKPSFIVDKCRFGMYKCVLICWILMSPQLWELPGESCVCVTILFPRKNKILVQKHWPLGCWMREDFLFLCRLHCNQQWESQTLTSRSLIFFLFGDISFLKGHLVGMLCSVSEKQNYVAERLLLDSVGVWLTWMQWGSKVSIWACTSSSWGLKTHPCLAYWGGALLFCCASAVL